PRARIVTCRPRVLFRSEAWAGDPFNLGPEGARCAGEGNAGRSPSAGLRIGPMRGNADGACRGSPGAGGGRSFRAVSVPRLLRKLLGMAHRAGRGIRISGEVRFLLAICLKRKLEKGTTQGTRSASRAIRLAASAM